MSPEELHERFAIEIDQRALDDKYIDGMEERELLQIAIQHGFATDWARGNLAKICAERGYIIEAAVEKFLLVKLREQLAGEGRLTQAAFEKVVAEGIDAVRGTTRTAHDVRKLIVTAMEDHGLNRVRSGFFNNWYLRLKRDMGFNS